MSHWFHRSVLKATTLISFNNVMEGSFNLTKLASDLKKVRDRVLDYLPDPSHTLETMNVAFISYLSMMSGFFMDYKLSGKKIRYSYVFKWTHSLLGQNPQVQQDAAFDIANMSVNIALWHMKHASYVASKKLVSMDDAKEMHTSLRKAAGIFQMVIKEILPTLEPAIPGSDLDPRVLNAYYIQCTAEAQEVTVARAIQLQHSEKLISALSHETSILFETAKTSLKGVEKKLIDQWVYYLEVKRNIYLAFAYCYSGKHLLKEDRCGDAIRNLKESQVYYNKAMSLCKSYSKVKGPAKPVKPDGHSFFTSLSATVQEMQEKCDRENDFIYHQKIPDSPISLEKKITFGLASPEVYTLPQPIPLWEAAFETKEVVATAIETPLKLKVNKQEEDLPPVREKFLPDEKGPTDDNGCVLQ
ncbi:hypothetical protein RUM43_008493 [Polyplax serrata]|uniref:BRO1 domain-containing protein n=1 Tax=Polyplax serrata TaxID=468196 RepID=A0AAN8S0K2_POLSC